MRGALSRLTLFFLLKLQELFSKHGSIHSFMEKTCPTLRMAFASVVLCCAPITPTSAVRQRNYSYEQ